MKDKERVELHCHTAMSQMNGVTSVLDILEFVKQQKMPAVAFTDHSNILAYPEIQHWTKKMFAEIKPIYGIECLVVEDILPADQLKSKVLMGGMPAYYVLLLVKNEKGCKNLFQLVTEANMKIDHNNQQPWITWSTLLEHRDGILVGSACSVGELMHSIICGCSDEILKRITQRYDFLEVQPAGNDLWLLASDKYENYKTEDDLRNVHKKIIELGDELRIPVVATSDTHFLRPENAISRAVVMTVQERDIEARNELYFRTTQEMLTEFLYLGEEKAYEIVVTNTNVIAEKIKHIKPIENTKYVVKIDDADLKLRRLCYEAINKKCDMESVSSQHMHECLEKELEGIEKNGFAEIYLHYHEMIIKNNLRPSQYHVRGKAAGSVVSYLLEISKENPLDKELVLYDEFFAGWMGDIEPDIDLCFDKRLTNQVITSVGKINGVGKVLGVATYFTPSERRLGTWIADYEKNRGLIIEEEQKKQIYRKCKDVVYIRGKKRPGRFMIIPKGIDEKQLFPLDRDCKDLEIVPHFSYYDINHMFSCYDVVPHDGCALLAMLEERTGYYPTQKDISDIKFLSALTEATKLQLRDEERYGVWSDLPIVPDAGINFMMEIIDECQPCSYADYLRIIALSHSDGAWLQSGKVLIKKRKVTLQEIIATVEDVYEGLFNHGISRNTAYIIAESVRKGKMAYGEGRPQYEEIMRSHNVPEWFIFSCKIIKYLSSRANGAEYVQLLLRVLYYKINYSKVYQDVLVDCFREDIDI